MLMGCAPRCTHRKGDVIRAGRAMSLESSCCHRLIHHPCVRELIESLIKQVDVPVRVAGIEVDAVFLYAIKSRDGGVLEQARREPRRPGCWQRLLGMQLQGSPTSRSERPVPDAAKRNVDLMD